MPEAAWRDWLIALDPPRCSMDDLVLPDQRLMVVSPHPDDEVLACGGLIAQQVRRGGGVSIVAVTDGEASHRSDGAWTAPRLAATRRIERQRGLSRLGLRASDVMPLGLPDGEVEAHSAQLESVLQTLLRPNDCVVTTWSLDGHPDHEATGATTQRVCSDLGCRLIEAPVWMWHWSQPADRRVPWHRLRALGLPRLTLADKAAALSEHRTQLAERSFEPPVLGTAIRMRAARAAEYFFV